MQNNPIAVLVLIVLAAAGLIASQGVATVESGNVGVVRHFGAVQEGIMQPGLVF